MTVTVDYIQQWDRRVTGVASTGQHCLVFKHTRLIQEALECESLKSQDRARTEPQCWRGRKVKKKKRKKHRNVQQQKTMTTCFENKKKSFSRSTSYASIFLLFRPRGLKDFLGVGGGEGTMWDTDAHTEHLHRPAPQKSRAQRVHIQ